MTVAEMIKILQTMPQDAIVERMNTEEDRWIGTHFEEIKEIECDYFEKTVTLM